MNEKKKQIFLYFSIASILLSLVCTNSIFQFFNISKESFLYMVVVLITVFLPILYILWYLSKKVRKTSFWGGVIRFYLIVLIFGFFVLLIVYGEYYPWIVRMK